MSTLLIYLNELLLPSIPKLSLLLLVLNSHFTPGYYWYLISNPHWKCLIFQAETFQNLFPQRNRNFKTFHSKKIVKNRQNRKDVDLTPSTHFSKKSILFSLSINWRFQSENTDYNSTLVYIIIRYNKMNSDSVINLAR